MLTATHLYSGMLDYWGGDGDRWDDNKGCLFATYGHGTTLRNIVDEWVEDFNSGGDCDTMPESITDNDVRAALLAMLTDEGRAGYESGAVAECAIDYVEANDPAYCIECSALVGEEHKDGCEYWDYRADHIVEIEDCEDEYGDSPVCIVLLACDVCPVCGEVSGDTDLCDKCYCADFEENNE